MSLRQNYEKGFKAALEKHAVSGPMYARALQGAAQRAGGGLGAKVLGQVAAQPRAQMSPFLSGEARMPRALTPSPQQQSMQSMMHEVPWAGSEHVGTPSAQARQVFDQSLTAAGRTHQGSGGMEQQILQRFGPTRHSAPMKPMVSPEAWERTESSTARHQMPVDPFNPTGLRSI